MSEQFQPLRNFHYWVMSQPVENRRILLAACRALVTDLEHSLASEGDDGTSTEPFDYAEHGLISQATSGADWTDTTSQVPSSPPLPAHERDLTLSPEMVSLPSIEVFWLRLSAGRQRERALALSTTTGSWADFSDDLHTFTPPLESNTRIVSTATVVHRQRQYLPDVFHARGSSSAPHWRWSDPGVAASVVRVPAGELPLGRQQRPDMARVVHPAVLSKRDRLRNLGMAIVRKLRGRSVTV